MKTLVDKTKVDEYSWQVQDHEVDALTLRERLSLLKKASQGGGKSTAPGKYTRFFPHATLFTMVCAVLLMDAILPLRDLWFHEATLTQMGPWPVAPSLLLFPGWSVIPPISQPHVTTTPGILLSWGTLAMLFGTFAVVFLVYIFALRRLPALVSRRFILRSTLVLGLLFLLIPVVTSLDIYSYIAYARAGVMYWLNPLTATPSAIHTDIIYRFATWVDQPSAYGPTWTLLTCSFQWLLSICYLGGLILPMVLALRLWGLAMHLSSVALIWSISGSLQRLHGTGSQERRLRATLAFAWNPLLLLEACTNAHNDTTLLFLVLLMIWFLVRAQVGLDAQTKPNRFTRLFASLHPALRARLFYLAPAIILALGVCLKVNLVLLAPGLFFYQWLQEAGQPLRSRVKRVGLSVATFAGLIIALYAPFWQGGAVLYVFKVNPSTYRTTNTLPDTLSHLYNSVAAAFGFPLGALFDSPAERFFHTLSMALFVVIYAGLCWQVWRKPGLLRNIHGLLRWLAITWLLYCAVGSPWFWPWYLITFFGLYALIDATRPAQIVQDQQRTATGFAGLMQRFELLQARLLHPGVISTLTFSMLTLYCFDTWATEHSFVPLLPGLLWTSLGGAWAWGLPLVRLCYRKIIDSPPQAML